MEILKVLEKGKANLLSETTTKAPVEKKNSFKPYK